MVAVAKHSQTHSKSVPKVSKTDIKKSKFNKKKVRSIHATSPEENLQNRIKNQEKKAKKLDRVKKRADNRSSTGNFIENVKVWVANSGHQPKGVPRQTTSTEQPKRYEKTYKLFLRNLASNTTARSIEKHFEDLNVEILCIRLFVQSKDEKCLGWAFLEVSTRLEFEVALTKNLSRFLGQLMTVEGTLRNFAPSKKKSQRIIIYRPGDNKKQLLGNKNPTELAAEESMDAQ